MKNTSTVVLVILLAITLGASAAGSFLYFGSSNQLFKQTENNEIPEETEAARPMNASPGLTTTYLLEKYINSEPTATKSSNQPLDLKTTVASIFWVGEAADASNSFIPNDKSAWDSFWQERYGGIDSPDDRCGYKPCSFTPKENPFYFALPYNDLDPNGHRKLSAVQVPWFSAYQDQKSILKNRWIQVARGDLICYAQWQDVGPLETDDFAYVFGNEPPKNTFGVKAGLDISPAVRDCLKMTTNELVKWKFVEDNQVPLGPWKEIVTTSPVQWQQTLPGD